MASVQRSGEVRGVKRRPPSHGSRAQLVAIRHDVRVRVILRQQFVQSGLRRRVRPGGLRELAPSGVLVVSWAPALLRGGNSMANSQFTVLSSQGKRLVEPFSIGRSARTVRGRLRPGAPRSTPSAQPNLNSFTLSAPRFLSASLTRFSALFLAPGRLRAFPPRGSSWCCAVCLASPFLSCSHWSTSAGASLAFTAAAFLVVKR